MKTTVEAYVQAFVAEVEGAHDDLARLVTTPSGLGPEEMIQAMSHPMVGSRAIPMMADFMAVDGSIYYDAIFGAYYGQSAIRAWLVPAMAEITFIDFVPTAEPVVIDDGLGGTWLDEWQMVMNLDGAKIFLSRGVSVRRYRDGWLNWACDVYDTAAFRQPPPAEMDGPPPPELPPCPTVDWQRDASVVPSTLVDPRLTAGPFHEDESVFHHPVGGEMRGRAAIEAWIAELAVDTAVYEPLGPLVSNATTSVQEWKRLGAGSDGATEVLRGTSVRRYADGLTVYAADYFDTASPGSIV